MEKRKKMRRSKMKPLILLLILITNYSLFSQALIWELTSQNLTGNTNFVYYTSRSELFAGTFNNGVYCSNDKGKSWSQKNNGLSNLQVFAIAEHKDTLYLGTLGGVYKSTDNGSTWVVKNNGLTDTYINALATTRDKRILAGTLYSGLFISTSFGDSWTQMQNDFSNKSVNCILAKSDGFVFVGTTSGLYRATLLFDFWGKVDADFQKNTNINTIALDSNGVLYAGTNNGFVYKSTNNGVNWTKVFEVPKSQIFRIAVSRTNSVFVATYGNGIYRSVDGGKSWAEVNDGLFNPYVTSIICLPSQELFASTWGNGVFYGKEFVISTYAEGEFCTGNQISVDFKVIQQFSFADDNYFIAQLSDKSGKFDSTLELGRIQSKSSGTIVGVIPNNIQTGILYRVRVVSTNPSMIGSDNRKNIKIYKGLNPTISGKGAVCVGAIEKYSTPIKPGVISIWTINNGEFVSISDSTMTVEVKWNREGKGTLYLFQKLQNGYCEDSTKIIVDIYSNPPKPVITRQGYVLYSSSKNGNQWFLFGEPIEGATADSLPVQEPGLYSVRVTNEFGCVSEMSDEYNFYYNSAEEYKDPGIDVFPTPANNYLQINATTDIYSIRLCDILGNVAKEVHPKETLVGSFLIDVSELTAGSYLLYVLHKSGIDIKKVIIIK